MKKHGTTDEVARGGLSRRSFLMGAGALSLGAAGLGLAGCGGQAQGTSGEANGEGGPVTVDYASTVPWNAEYDVVVVGFGGAGAVASMTAADEGARVLLTEKAPLGEEGGNTRYCGQAILCFDDHDGGVKFLKNMTAGFESATDEIIDYMVKGTMENEEWLLSVGAGAFCSLDKIAQAYGFSQEGESGDWLSDSGTGFAEYPERIMPGGDHTYVINVGEELDNGKKLFWKLLRQNVVDRKDKIDVWFDSPALELIQDPLTKTILGLKVKHGGEELNVRALNGVVLGCGSYEASLDKFANYAGLPAAYPMGSLYNTGDGIDMGLAVGADLWHMSALSGPWLSPKYPDVDRTYFFTATQRLTNGGGCINVGGDGTRFVAESGWQKHGHINYSGTWKSQVCPDVMYSVFDQTAMDSGGDQTKIDSSLIISADSLEELAQKIEIDPEALTATVARYNGYVDAGVDEQFDRHPGTLAKLETAPYYAVRLYPGCVNCQGGPRRNVECEVLDVAGNPIPRLYSAGELGSFWTDVYCGGGNIAETMYTGRTAGKNAAQKKDDLVPVELQPAASDIQSYGSDLDAAEDVQVELDENEYLGTGQGLHGDIKAKVKVENGKVAAVEVVEQHESEGIADDVWTVMPSAMVSAGVAEVDTITGATLASNGLIEAVNDALAQAK